MSISPLKICFGVIASDLALRGCSSNNAQGTYHAVASMRTGPPACRAVCSPAHQIANSVTLRTFMQWLPPPLSVPALSPLRLPQWLPTVTHWLPQWQRRDGGPIVEGTGQRSWGCRPCQVTPGPPLLCPSYWGALGQPRIRAGFESIQTKTFFFWRNDRNGWATPSGAQGILPALCSGVISDCDQGDHTRCPLLLYSLLPLLGTSRSLDCVSWAEKVGPVIL